MGTKIGDIVYKRGDTKPIRLTIIDKATKQPADITGCAFLFTVDPEPEPTDDSNNLFALVGVVDPDQVANKGKVKFEPSETNSGTVGFYFFDVQMVDTSGYKDTFVGPLKFDIMQDIGKA